MTSSLKTRLLTGTGLGVLALFAISGVLVSFLIELSLWSEFDHGLRERAIVLSQLVELEPSGLNFEWNENNGALVPIPLAGDRELLTVLQAGKVQAVLPANVAPLDLPAETSGDIFDSRLQNGSKVRTVAITFEPRLQLEDNENTRADLDSTISDSPTPVTLLFARSTAELEATIAHLRGILVGVGVCGLLATLVLVWNVVDYGLRPIAQATSRIATLNARTLDGRIENDARQPRELKPLLTTINELLDRLESAFERERAFSADVAHELRTPLSGLRAKCEVALSKSRTADEHKQTLEQCLRITEQATAIVENLLSTTEQTNHRNSEEIILLPALWKKLLKEFESALMENQLGVDSAIPDGLVVTANRGLVSMLFRNLLDNAICYADPESTIQCGATTSENSATVKISNLATEFSPADIDSVFQRFWRADTARAATGRHSGLGLPLCQRLIHSMGGEIEATWEDGVFTVQITFENEKLA